MNMLYLICSLIISVVCRYQDLMNCCEIHPRTGFTHWRERVLWSGWGLLMLCNAQHYMRCYLHAKITILMPKINKLQFNRTKIGQWILGNCYEHELATMHDLRMLHAGGQDGFFLYELNIVFRISIRWVM